MEEEPDDEDVDLGPKVRDLVDSMHSVHMDNAKLQYYAEGRGQLRIQMMPMTSFVYEYFIFNSLYQVDWECFIL